MRGVILAGGNGTRLHPLTKATNKHLLPIGSRMMIEWPIATMADAGITEVQVVTGGKHFADLARALGDGSEYGLDVSYAVQRRPAGIADALMRARCFAAGDPVFVMLGDNVFTDHFAGFLADHPRDRAGVFLVEHEQPEAYGVAIEVDGRLMGIVEKPAREEITPGSRAVSGAYVFPADVFDVIEQMQPSARNEYEISDVNQWFIDHDRMIAYHIAGQWFDCGENLQQYHAVNERVQRCDN